MVLNKKLNFYSLIDLVDTELRSLDQGIIPEFPETDSLLLMNDLMSVLTERIIFSISPNFLSGWDVAIDRKWIGVMPR